MMPSVTGPVNELSFDFAVLRRKPSGLHADDVRYLDYQIDGQSLFDWIKWCAPDPEALTALRGNYLTPFAPTFPPAYRRAAYRRLLLREAADVSTGQTSLYVCPCGALDCGAISACIESKAGVISWSAINVPGRDLSALPTFTFAREAYVSALASVAAV